MIASKNPNIGLRDCKCPTCKKRYVGDVDVTQAKKWPGIHVVYKLVCNVCLAVRACPEMLARFEAIYGKQM